MGAFMTNVFLILGAIIFLLAVWLVGVYNNLITLKNQTKNAWAQIDVQLQRRYDLIPNLVDSVKAYMGHEKSTLEEIVKLRDKAMSSLHQFGKSGLPVDTQTMGTLTAADTALQGALTKLVAVVENYPDLKASANMQKLQEELSSTENKVSFARQAYNDQVLRYNNAQQYFPAFLVAPMFGHQMAQSYEVSDAKVKENVRVSF